MCSLKCGGSGVSGGGAQVIRILVHGVLCVVWGEGMVCGVRDSGSSGSSGGRVIRMLVHGVLPGERGDGGSVKCISGGNSGQVIRSGVWQQWR